MEDHAKNPPLTIPANIGKLIMIVLGVANDFGFNIIRMRIGFCILGKELLDYLTVLLKLIHCLISC